MIWVERTGLYQVLTSLFLYYLDVCTEHAYFDLINFSYEFILFRLEDIVFKYDSYTFLLEFPLNILLSNNVPEDDLFSFPSISYLTYVECING